jgi:hypothetical protein
LAQIDLTNAAEALTGGETWGDTRLLAASPVIISRSQTFPSNSKVSLSELAGLVCFLL